jgi:hypothetical protein
VGGTSTWLASAFGTVTGQWATTSGGANTATQPGSGDTALFSASSTGTCTLSGNPTVLAISFAAYTSTFNFGDNYVNVQGASGTLFTQNTSAFTLRWGKYGPLIKIGYAVSIGTKTISNTNTDVFLLNLQTHKLLSILMQLLGPIEVLHLVAELIQHLPTIPRLFMETFKIITIPFLCLVLIYRLLLEVHLV